MHFKRIVAHANTVAGIFCEADIADFLGETVWRQNHVCGIKDGENRVGNRLCHVAVKKIDFKCSPCQKRGAADGHTCNRKSKKETIFDIILNMDHIVAVGPIRPVAETEKKKEGREAGAETVETRPKGAIVPVAFNADHIEKRQYDGDNSDGLHAHESAAAIQTVAALAMQIKKTLAAFRSTVL